MTMAKGEADHSGQMPMHLRMFSEKNPKVILSSMSPVTRHSEVDERRPCVRLIRLIRRFLIYHIRHNVLSRTKAEFAPWSLARNTSLILNLWLDFGSIKTVDMPLAGGLQKIQYSNGNIHKRIIAAIFYKFMKLRHVL